MLLGPGNAHIKDAALFAESIGVRFAEDVFEDWAVADLRGESSYATVAVKKNHVIAFEPLGLMDSHKIHLSPTITNVNFILRVVNLQVRVFKNVNVEMITDGYE